MVNRVTIEKGLKRVKGLKKHPGLEKMVENVMGIVNDIAANGIPENLRPHKVTVDGVRVLSLTPSGINRIMNNTGPGDYRLLVNINNYAPYGMATHRNSGGYNLVSRF